MFRTICTAIVLLTGVALADIPPVPPQPDRQPQPLPDPPHEPDVPADPGDIIAAFAALSAAIAGTVMLRRARR